MNNNKLITALYKWREKHSISFKCGCVNCSLAQCIDETLKIYLVPIEEYYLSYKLYFSLKDYIFSFFRGNYASKKICY